MSYVIQSRLVYWYLNGNFSCNSLNIALENRKHVKRNLRLDGRNKHSKITKCIFQRSYTGTSHRHPVSHSRHSIHLPYNGRSQQYGRKQRQEYNTGRQRRTTLLLWVQHLKATNLLGTTHLHSRAWWIVQPPWLWICIFSWRWLSERNQGLYF